MDKFTLVSGNLHRNGQPQQCPFQPPLLVPVQQNQGLKLQPQTTVMAKWRSCGNWCPLFDSHRENEDVMVLIVRPRCASSPMVLSVELIEAKASPEAQRLAS